MSNRSSAAGFTLIEVIVALAIGALGLAALLAAVSQGLGNATAADRFIEATRRAQNRLAAVGSVQPLTPGERTGDDGGGYAWDVQIGQPTIHRTKTGAVDDKQPGLYPVTVTIAWQSGAQRKHVSLSSLKLGGGQVPSPNAPQ